MPLAETTRAPLDREIDRAHLRPAATDSVRRSLPGLGNPDKWGSVRPRAVDRVRLLPSGDNLDRDRAILHIGTCLATGGCIFCVRGLKGAVQPPPGLRAGSRRPQAGGTSA